MTDYCLNKLFIEGNEKDTMNFLNTLYYYDFFIDTKGLYMANIYQNYDDYEDVTDSDDFQAVCRSKNTNGNKITFCVNFITTDLPPENLIKDISKLCPNVKLYLYFYNENKIAGLKFIKNNECENVEFYKYKEEDELILYKFAIKNNLFTIKDVEELIKNPPSNKVQEYLISCINGEEDGFEINISDINNENF